MAFKFTTTYNAGVVVGESVFKSEKTVFTLKTRSAISGVGTFYNAGVVNESRRIGSRLCRKLMYVRLLRR
jgi:hypothetical protein